MIDSLVVQQVLETARIDEVVGEFVSLRRRGANLLGNCPFHNEKTPSFTVSPSKGIFKCFGCGKSGNVAGFLMEHEHFSFPEAIRYLAKKYNIEIHEEEASPEQIQQQNERDALFHVSEFAQKYFLNLLFEDEKGKAIGLSYFHERGFSDEIIKKFGLGYCLDEWDNFTQHALKNGYSTDVLTKTGLTIEKEERRYDRFRGRVMFPVHSVSGRVLGFSGRILSSEKQAAKYVNSPESDIYNKSRTLYGIFFAKNAISRNDICYLVEGNMDVVALHQAGIENTVASSGTSLTEEQIKIIKRYTKNITILYDGDAAGIKAAFRATDMLFAEGLNVRIVLFPDGEDPDSYARMHGNTALQEFIEKNSDNFILFKTHYLAKEAANDPIRKAELIKDILHSISLIPDIINRSVYIKECSSLLDIEEQTLTNELAKLLRNKSLKEISANKKETPTQQNEQLPPENEAIDSEENVQSFRSPIYHAEAQERKIINLLLNWGKSSTNQTILGEDGVARKEAFYVAAFIIGDIVNDNLTFENPLYQQVFDAYTENMLKGEILSEQYFIQHENPEFRDLAASLLTQIHSVSNKWFSRFQIYVPTPETQEKIDIDIRDSLLSFKLKKLDKRIDDLQQKIKETDNDDDLLILLNELKTLKSVRVYIASELKRVVS